MYLPGDGGGEATIHLLYGRTNPSGKLAETFPCKLADTSAYLNFPGENCVTEYREGVFAGYRYYDKKQMEVLFPFGHGLSYTNFAYSDLKLDKGQMADTDLLTLQLTVTNTGDCFGKETVQLYIAPPEGLRQRPLRELKAFSKVALQPGESKVVCFTLSKRDFSYYEPLFHDFYAESGCYHIEIGASSRDIRLKGSVQLIASKSLPHTFSEYSTLSSVIEDPRGVALLGPILQRLTSEAAKQAADSDTTGTVQMMGGMLLNTLVAFGVLTEEQLNKILSELNR